MSKAIIHVGTHKTATTFLQNTFSNNRSLLASDNIIYPSIGEIPAHHILASEWLTRMPTRFHPKGGHKKIWDFLIEKHADGDKTIFLSSEELSRIEPLQVNMAQLRDRLSAFDEVEVVCTLKPQHSFIQSAYLEVSKKRTPKPLSEILQAAYETHLAEGLAVNYSYLYDHLLTGFAKEEITFVPFQKVVKQENGILGEFLDIVGYSKGFETIKQVTTPVNVSPDPLTVWIANFIEAKKPLSKKTIDLIQSVLGQHFKTVPKTTIFLQKEVEKMAAVFDPLNRELEERIAFKQPDFKLDPITFDSTSITRADIDAAFWRKLLRAHYRRNFVK